MLCLLNFHDMVRSIVQHCCISSFKLKLCMSFYHLCCGGCTVDGSSQTHWTSFAKNNEQVLPCLFIKEGTMVAHFSLFTNPALLQPFVIQKVFHLWLTNGYK